MNPAWIEAIAGIVAALLAGATLFLQVQARKAIPNLSWSAPGVWSWSGFR